MGSVVQTNSLSQCGFGGSGFADAGTAADAFLEGNERRPLRKVDTGPLAPVKDRKQIAVSDRECFAGQKIILAQLFGDVSQSLAQILPYDGFVFLGRFRVEQRAKAFVDLGVDETEPFLQLITLKGTGFRCQ